MFNPSLGGNRSISRNKSGLGVVSGALNVFKAKDPSSCCSIFTSESFKCCHMSVAWRVSIRQLSLRKQIRTKKIAIHSLLKAWTLWCLVLGTQDMDSSSSCWHSVSYIPPTEVERATMFSLFSWRKLQNQTWIIWRLFFWCCHTPRYRQVWHH